MADNDRENTNKHRGRRRAAGAYDTVHTSQADVKRAQEKRKPQG